VTDALRVRGSIGTSFRAPALYEQFLLLNHVLAVSPTLIRVLVGRMRSTMVISLRLSPTIALLTAFSVIMRVLQSRR
jgi:hypothetical protein